MRGRFRESMFRAWMHSLWRRWIGGRRRLLDLFWPPDAQELVTRTLANGPVAVVKEPAGVEPRFGYIVHSKLGVIDRSLPHAMELVRDPRRRYLYWGLPSLRRLLFRQRTTRVRGMPLSLRNPWEGNYFHATIECIGALASYQEHDLLRDNTVVVGQALARTGVWREFIECGGLSSQEFVVQTDDWVVGSGGACFVDVCVAPRSDPKRAVLEVSPSFLLRTLRLLASVLPQPHPGPDVRLYVRRGSGLGRRLRNEVELERELVASGFLSVDPGSMSWVDQALLFRRAETVVGVHGAALTNVIYRWPRPMTLLEITEPGWEASYYRDLARELRYEYMALAGGNATGLVQRQDFDVDVGDVMRLIGG